MEKIKALFTAHPADIGETYWKHLRVALALSAKLVMCGVAQLIHAVFPFFRPPFGLDVCTMSDYLQNKKPAARKNCKD